MTFTLDSTLATIVRPGILWFDGATVVARDHEMDAPLAAAEAAVRINPPIETTAVRTMYKRIGIDPTKTRPSSEALLRRVKKGDTLPRINAMVDVCNWCSFEFQLPYGLYDASHIRGEVMLRIGREGESYPGIRKDDVHVSGRIALVDEAGPFGNPTSDSARTMVTTATTSALLVVFAPRDVDTARLTRVMDVTSERMQQYTGCRETGRLVGRSN
jgi:DNA/RNA-binding domain of Phe-tRNA-synthetase-like protein